MHGFACKLGKGEIASLSGAEDDSRYFQISVPVQPGNSGGALVDEHGNAVGVVSAIRDWVSANMTLKRGLCGTKPDAFCFWLFDVLNLQPGRRIPRSF